MGYEISSVPTVKLDALDLMAADTSVSVIISKVSCRFIFVLLRNFSVMGVGVPTLSGKNAVLKAVHFPWKVLIPFMSGSTSLAFLPVDPTGSLMAVF